MDISTLTDRIISGFRLDRSHDTDFLVSSDLPELCMNADRIRSALCGNYIELCSIINGKSGRCSENCKFCAQSGHYCTSAGSYDFLDDNIIIDECRHNKSKGINRFSVVTAGRTLNDSDFRKAVSVYKKLSNENIGLCASHGLLNDEQFSELRSAGVSRYHCNIETSERFFPEICTTHTYADKISCIERAKKNGLSVCSGGIFGMGETWQDRIDMAFSLAELEIKSIPINILKPVKNTPFGNLEPLCENEILRIVAVFRFINPDAHIRLASGRNTMENCGQNAFRAGADSAISGDMLTTSGNDIESDIKMLKESGFAV